ncbi:MAG: hypothetical protein NT091_04585 [Candidatus Falkowbacteria bacterium]|nr:hypothetical protein [Candidatus Falkowbacteria bacterium]
MLQAIYLKKLKDEVNSFFNQEKEVKVFIFGSSLTQDHFGDIDIGLIGTKSSYTAIQLKEKITSTNFPYFVDVIDFNSVSAEFKNNIFNNEILWIRP